MRTLALIALACAVEADVHSASAQVVANVEAGLSDVRYDGFLASAAASISPTVWWEQSRGRAFVSARGTYLRFESGRHSLDGSASGSWFAPLGGRWRGQFGLSGGSSQYATIASFSHTEAEARLHLMGGSRGGWVGATIGRSSFGGGPRRVLVVATGLWLVHTDRTIFVSLDRSFVGDTAYTDLRSSGRWRRGNLALEGIVGARMWSRGGGRGVFGEGSAALTLTPQAAFVVSAGRYPTDVVSGSIAGRYITVALRFGTLAVRRPTPILPVATHASGSSSEETRLEIQPTADTDDDVRITLYAAGATTVEVSGDFTDWQPVPLSRSAGDVWTGTFRISRGVHRINVRRDGGRWMAPAGTTRSNDDYDGEVGVFVLP
ncbi:MAG TPA: glycogen-binding domain-containing protein [Gemmatimonadales bacterium]|nr:glycogen-binding domain-containing protein [Gemmatimonadales bacterium]